LTDRSEGKLIRTNGVSALFAFLKNQNFTHWYCIKIIKSGHEREKTKTPLFNPGKGAAIDRLLLYAVTGVVGPVSASKQLFTMRDFKRNE
jgi:hypothetical protein